MKKHKRKALRRAFTAVFFLTLIALALVAYGLLCWRAGQYKNNLEGQHGGNVLGQAGQGLTPPATQRNASSGPASPPARMWQTEPMHGNAEKLAGSNPAPSTLLPQRPEKVEGQDLSSGVESPRAGFTGVAKDTQESQVCRDTAYASRSSRCGDRPTQFTSKPKEKHPTTASGARSNPMPFYPWKVSPKQSVWLYRDYDRSKE